jgi:hypothetical protein
MLSALARLDATTFRRWLWAITAVEDTFGIFMSDMSDLPPGFNRRGSH